MAELGAFGTDRYPPFTLAEDPAYPAHLEVEYPQRLSRGLALVKWWLLAIPQYIIICLFTGGVAWWGFDAGYGSGVPNAGYGATGWTSIGLIGLLAVIAGVVLLVTGRYPEQLYNFVVGLNRWVLRVAGYAALMTDRYPPFRLDMGGPDPGTLTLPPPGSASQDLPGASPPQPGRWTGASLVAAVAGAVLILCAVGLIVVFLPVLGIIFLIGGVVLIAVGRASRC